MGVNIVVDGTTGVGKSSLVKILTEELGYIAYSEIFRDDNNLLGRFFTEGRRWCFPMQISFLNNRYVQYQEASMVQNTVMDRSVFSDPIFAHMYLQDGNMSYEEHCVYTSLFRNLTATLTPPEVVIYLDTTVKEAIRRVRARGREDELLMPEEYWENLHESYSLYYKNYDASPLLKIDVTHLDYVHRKKDRQFMIGTITQYLRNENLKLE